MPDDEQRWRRAWTDLAEQARGRSVDWDPLTLFRVAIAQGLVSDWREISGLAGPGAMSEVVDPALVADFLIALTSSDEPLRVLDPWAGLGVTIGALESVGRLKSGLAIEINESVFELARELWPRTQVEWRLGDSAVVLSNSAGPFDLIVGQPPIGLPRSVLESRSPPIALTASKTYTMLVQAALTLAPGGSLIVVLAESFFARPNESVRDALAAASVYPSSVLALPHRVFSTPAQMSLVVFTHENHEQLFTAELDPSTDLGAVASNLRARRNGNLPELGLLVQAATFTSWRSTIRDIEIRTAARGAGLRPVPLDDLCIDMHAPRRSTEVFDPLPNSVYLPKLGTSPAVTSRDAFAIQAHNYLQLVVRPDIADPEYVATFFNAPIGRMIREQLASGVTIPQISLTSLRQGSAYLPPFLTQQHAAVRIGRILGEFKQSVVELERRLRERPLDAARLESDLRKLIEGDGLERWMNTLPFPLASVLYRYVIDDDPERRCQYLVRFFEATTVFLVDVHLSALQRQPQLLEKVVQKRHPGVSYTRVSIGIWANLLARLAKQVREATDKEPDTIRELFQVADRRRLEAIAAKSVVAALMDEAAHYRRDWFGHPAVVSPAEWETRLSQGEATLARIRAGLEDAFVGWELIRAGQGRNRGGVIRTDVELLVGSQRPFKRGAAELLELPEDGGLYMHESVSMRVLRLAPLFMLSHSPASVEDACYFYDRLDADEVRWVSFHHEPQPELHLANPSVAGLVRELDALG